MVVGKSKHNKNAHQDEYRPEKKNLNGRIIDIGWKILLYTCVNTLALKAPVSRLSSQ